MEKESRFHESKRQLMSLYLTKQYERILGSTVSRDSKVVSNGTGLNRELIQGIASALFDATLERIYNIKENNTISIEEDFEKELINMYSHTQDNFWKDENFRQDYEYSTTSEEEESNIDMDKPQIMERISKSAQDHFIDILLDKMISTLLPDHLPEREQFTQRIEELARRKSRPISITILARNLRILTAKLGVLFEFQDLITRLITWRNPSQTITMLIILTAVCFNPILLFALPLFYMLFCLMIPGYQQRHFLRPNIYLNKQVYGQSLFETLLNSRKSSWKIHGKFNEHRQHTVILDEDVDKANNIKQGMEFIVNLRDLQNLMSSIVTIIDKIDKFIYGTAGFKDEQYSTNLFLFGLLILLFLWVFSSFINWSLIVSIIIWVAIIAIHPRIRPKIFKLIRKEKVVNNKERDRHTQKYNIIMDEAPEVRIVEIFEIYKQGITPKHWSFYIISSQVFDPFDKFRKSQKPPPGVDSFDKLSPPPTWSFDTNADWEIDYNVKGWSMERGLDLPIQNEFLVDDMFKRRRLTRKVMRYANPARKPPYI